MKRRHHLVLAVAAASLILTGCGDTGTAIKTAAGSAELDKQAGTVLTADDFVAEITAAMAKAKSSHVDMKIDSFGQKMEAAGDVEVGKTAAEAKAALTMDVVSTNSFEMRLIDQNLYINLGQMTDNKYSKLDLTDKSNPIGEQYGRIIDGLDPAKQIELFKDAMTSFNAKGKVIELDGVKSQPYEITLDLSAIPSIAEHGDESGGSMPKKVVFTMFVGPDNLPRRLTTDVAGSGVTVDYSKWGEPVDIEAPPESEIGDTGLLRDLLGQMGQAPAA
ncbi:MAG: hypothetical protein ACXWDC_06425 [Aeromicrobium sp.]